MFMFNGEPGPETEKQASLYARTSIRFLEHIEEILSENYGGDARLTEREALGLVSALLNRRVSDDLERMLVSGLVAKHRALGFEGSEEPSDKSLAVLAPPADRETLRFGL